MSHHTMRSILLVELLVEEKKYYKHTININIGIPTGCEKLIILICQLGVGPLLVLTYGCVPESPIMCAWLD